MTSLRPVATRLQRGNYRLFAAVPNHVIDSTSCGSPAVDDVAVTVGGATCRAASQTAALTIDHTAALAASGYRLFACGWQHGSGSVTGP